MSDDILATNGTQPHDGRSVSSTLHIRSRTSVSNAASATGLNNVITKRSPSKSRTQRVSGASNLAATQHPVRPYSALEHRKASSGQHASSSSASSSPPSGSARETFLNYFFGQNGPGPIAGSSVDRAHLGHNAQHLLHHPTSQTSATDVTQIIPFGRDVSEGETSLTSGLMAGKRGIINNNAAYDMKSLGKHIEAVSVPIQLMALRIKLTILLSSFADLRQIPANGAHLTAREEMETQLIRSLIQSYFNIVRQSIQDIIPKAIMHFLVNHTAQQVQNRLVAALYKPELFTNLLNEDEALVAERARVKALLEAYKEAFKTLADVNLKST